MDMSSGFSFGKRSLAVRAGLVPELQRIVDLAIKVTKQDFKLVSGLRTQAEQINHVASGASKTLNSRHLTGHAVDIVPYIGPGISPYPLQGDSAKVIKAKLSRFEDVAMAMFIAADMLDIPLQWGNDWDCDGVPTAKDPDEKGLIVDMPHFQIPWPNRLDAARRRAAARRAARAAGITVIS
jgi:peptidoglycan L-alanyl-D-glutamate endopeptidase CwlK